MDSLKKLIDDLLDEWSNPISMSENADNKNDTDKEYGFRSTKLKESIMARALMIKEIEETHETNSEE